MEVKHFSEQHHQNAVLGCVCPCVLSHVFLCPQEEAKVMRTQLEIATIRQEIDRRLAEKDEEFENTRSVTWGSRGAWRVPSQVKVAEATSCIVPLLLTAGNPKVLSQTLEDVLPTNAGNAAECLHFQPFPTTRARVVLNLCVA